jgi:predicted kinase
VPYQLVVVSGLPAAGKSTLSTRLGTDLGIPVIRRDRLRRAAFDSSLLTQPETRELVHRVTGAMVMALLESCVDEGHQVVLDGNFNTPDVAKPVRGFVEENALAAIEICLWGNPDVLRARFIDRGDPSLTDDFRTYFEHVLHRTREPVLRAPSPVFHVDTTDFENLDVTYPSLLAAIQARK